MDARNIISKLRDEEPLSASELAWFAQGLATGEVTDAQAGAFAMAVLLNGLVKDERIALTRAMRDSGVVLEWDMPGPVLDKHSTGDIGDSVSLLLAPALAACGAFVPMISGRGLGHTGGTLDKLESIPGYRAEVPVHRLRQVTAAVGCAIVGASGEIAPADKRLYAIRDVSGTVESVDLITASILSKKLAAGLEGLVLDIKVDSGAFMVDMEDAEELAEALVETAHGLGCMTTALITDMSQPLIGAAGNALEVIEVMETLTGSGITPALWDLTCALGGEALALGGLAADAADGAGRIARAMESGAAAERFGEMVAELGGPMDFVERWPDRLPAAPVQREVLAGRSGKVQSIDGHALGLAVVDLGGGRKREGDKVNPSVGLSELAMLGDDMSPDLPLAIVHVATEAQADAAVMAVRRAYKLGPDAPVIPPLVRRRLR
ncbi:thymidine phosphorylase [Actibacterium sp.]|uniref:thymidine phosphorylase n=1 Tax=Actibacterium sp. TaxID=1872125 RepID=UPI003565230B